MVSRFWGAVSLVVVFSTGLLAQGGNDVPHLHRHFMRGDSNGDGLLDVADPITTLGYLFGLTAITCHDAADFNDDEQLDIADPIASLGYQFGSGSLPAAPTSVCGPDPTLGFRLSCSFYDPCDDQTDVDTAAHVLRRIGYGPTPASLAHVQATGVSAYVDEQLYPATIDESSNAVLNLLEGLFDPLVAPENILYRQLARATYSERQLQETLTDFWENHFNTYVLTLNQFLNQVGDPNSLATAVSWEWQNNQYFREHALGSFYDLLLESSRGLAMIVYLDGYLNIAGQPNENFARELLELHTMGVDNGYLQSDIEEVARCFTGWRLCKKAPANVGDPFAPCLGLDDPTGIWTFHFDAPNHDFGAKLLFPGSVNQIVIPAGDAVVAPQNGLNDGLLVIDQLARYSPQTAEFVSSKLIQKLVAEEVPPALLAECISVWLASQGDLRQVVANILHSPEFLAPEYRWNKVKTPMEHHVSFIRSLDALTSTVPLFTGVGGQPNGLFGLNHVPFLFLTPDGQSELGIDWIGTTALLRRFTFVSTVIQSPTDPVFEPLLAMTNAGVDLANPQAVVDFWLGQVYQHGFEASERALAVAHLLTDASGDPAPLILMAPDYEFRVRSLIGFVCSGVQFQKQ